MSEFGSPLRDRAREDADRIVRDIINGAKVQALREMLMRGKVTRVFHNPEHGYLQVDVTTRKPLDFINLEIII
jgi:ABC-type oligopeptide transport system ATPase subunit